MSNRAPVRIVVDTNVLISAYIFQGLPAEVLNATSTRFVKGCISPTLIEELLGTLKNKFHQSDDVLNHYGKRLNKGFSVVHPEITLHVLQDEPDNRLLEAAIAGRCSFIITGDKKLLALGSYEETRIVTPRQFLDQHPK